MPHPGRVLHGHRPQVRYAEIIRADSPFWYVPAGDVYGLSDRAGWGRDGVAVGAPPIGGAAGPGRLKVTALDGATQRITTPLRNGRNRCTNPKAGSLATTNWVNNSLPTFDTTGSLPTTGGLPAGVTTGFHCIADASVDGMDFTMSGAVAGEIYTVSLYARNVALNGAARIELVDRVGTATATATALSANTRLTAIGGNFTRLHLGYTVTVGGTLKFGIRVSGTPTPTAEWHVTAVLVEQTTVVDVPGTYFDGQLPQIGGQTPPDNRWEGTAEISASDIGVFQNGKVRTITGWWNRANTAALHTLVSTDAASTHDPALWIDSGAEQVRFAFDPTGTLCTWADPTWPGTAQPVHVMLVADEPGDAALLLLNGVSKGSRASATPYAEAIGNLQLGAERSVQDFFSGSLGHVAVFDGDKSGRAAAYYAAGLAL